MPRCCGRRLSLRRPPVASVRSEARLLRQILVIFNPAAGRGRSLAKRLSRVVAELERRGCTVTVLPTQAPGDAERLAREADLAFDRLFLAMTGVGFDAEVLGALNPYLQRRIGKLGYIWAILLCLWRYRRAEFVVGIEGGEYRAASVIVTTGRLYAGRFVIAPDARLDVPLLHIMLFQRAGRLAVSRYLGAMLLGRLHRLADVSIVTARRASVAADKPAAGASVVETDGEIR